MKIGRTILVIAIAGILIALGLFASFDYIQNTASTQAPQNSLSITIKKSGTDEGFTGIIDLEPPSQAASFTGSNRFKLRPLSAFTQEFVGVDPDSFYELSFVISSTTTLKVGNETIGGLEGVATINGTTPNPRHRKDGSGDPFAPWNTKFTTFDGVTPPTSGSGSVDWKPGLSSTFTSGVTAIYDFSAKPFNTIYHATFDPTPGTKLMEVDNRLWGSTIDGSIFEINIIVKDTATDGLTYFGTATATLIINVDASGNLIVTVDSATAGAILG